MSQYNPPLTLCDTPALAQTPESKMPSSDENPAALYLASLGDSSRRTMHTALNTIAALLGVSEQRDEQGQDVRYLFVPWASLRQEHTAAVYAQLQERYAPATANKLLVALRRVLREARRMGQVSADDYNRAVELPVVKLQRQPKSRIVTEGEFTALLQVCAEDVTPAGVRDAAILALIRGTGLLRSEVVALDLANFHSECGELAVRTARNGSHRVVYLPEGTLAALSDWLTTRGDASGPLFYGLVKGGALVPRRLAGQAVALICASRGAEAGLAPFTPRDLRNSFISGLLDTGAEIAVVQRLAGHKQQSTTLRYDRRSEAAMRRVIALVRVPYTPRSQ
jgi:integrase